MKKNKLFLVGIFLGFTNLAICPLVSDKFEPFDSPLAFILGQILLISMSIYIGYRYHFKALIFTLLGSHLGQNLYIIFLGSDEQRTWFLLGFFTTLVFLFLPLTLGVMSVFISVAKTNKRI